MSLHYMTATEEAETPDKSPAASVRGLWTVMGSIIFLSVYAFVNHGFADVWPVLIDFATGNLAAARAHSESLVRLAPSVAATIAIDIPVMMLILPVLAITIRRADPDHKRKPLFNAKTPKRQFAVVMAMLVAEELFARFLFLGLLTKLPALSSDVAFYVLFFVGNGIWALVHLINYRESKKLRYLPTLVLPQFIGGIFLTSIYLSFGLLGAILTHVAYDMVLFAMDRKDKFNLGEISLIFYHLLVGGISLALFMQTGHDLREMKLWLDESAPGFALPGWSFGDYLLATLCVTSAGTVLLELLLFDREGGETLYEAIKQFALFLIGLLVAFVVMNGIAKWNEAALVKVLILSTLMTFVVKSASGSGVARAFWEAMTLTSLMVAATVAVGQEQAIWLVAIIGILHMPDRLIRHFDKDDVVTAVEIAKNMAILARP